MDEYGLCNQYERYITRTRHRTSPTGLSPLIEAAGGGSNIMLGMDGAMEDICIAARNTMMLCLFMLLVVLGNAPNCP